MAEVMATVLLPDDEISGWMLSRHTHSDGCGQTFFVAQTLDQNLAVSGSIESLSAFADGLRAAINQYQTMPVKENTSHG